MSTRLRKKIGARIVELRGDQTQRELAAKCGMSQAQLWEIETGNRNTTLDTLSKIAKGLGCELEVLFKERK